MNKNSSSIIKNSSVIHLSCMKSYCELESSANGQDVYVDTEKELRCTVSTKKHGNTSEAFTAVENISDKAVNLNQVSSAFVEIENTGKLPWYANGKYKVHFCRSCWLGEAQWQTSSLRDLGLYQTYCDHRNNCFISFSSLGSQTTSKYYPMIMIEDTECGKTHYFEILPHGSWYIEVCQGYAEDGSETICVMLAGGCEKSAGWKVSLKPGCKYESLPAIFGTVDGGFEEAVTELVKYKRETTKVKYEGNIPPVCYNDYMNCCWGMPNLEKAKALIDAAADAGAEVFCMDAGWNVKASDDSFNCIGDWAIAKEKFEPEGFEGIVKYANSKGLIFGAWLEVECVARKSDGFEEYSDCILTRYGDKVGDGNACFYDFTKQVIRDKIEKVFDMLYSVGVRYIKNDYNRTLGIGCDDENSLSEGLRKSAAAFLKFIDKIQNKYPDMIIENCGSGAMRSDSETLSHFHLQSVSDQEVYTCNPSIISGTMACMPAEKMGIWSYPYPIRYKDRMNYDIINEQLADFADGRQTVFNMVGAMLGTMYLSGRIDVADELNKKLIKESIEVYKEIRGDIANSYPIYPCGTFRIDDCGTFAFGNYVPEKKIAYIAVFKIGEGENNAEFDLSKYGTVKSAECIYPVMADYSAVSDSNTLKTSLPGDDSAMLVKVEF